MVATRQSMAREGTGLYFNITTTRRIRAGMAAIQEQNARRVPCATCGIGILPEVMDAHVKRFHSEDDDV